MGPGFDQTVEVVREEEVQTALCEGEEPGPVAAVVVADDDVAVYLGQAVIECLGEVVGVGIDVDKRPLDVREGNLARKASLPFL